VVTAWDRYVGEKVVGGRHRDFPGWELAPECGAWTFRRSSDGVLSHHKADTPFAFWERACEVSMSLWDSLYPGPVSGDDYQGLYAKVSAAMAESGL
jgi:hypothetical protein